MAATSIFYISQKVGECLELGFQRLEFRQSAKLETPGTRFNQIHVNNAREGYKKCAYLLTNLIFVTTIKRASKNLSSEGDNVVSEIHQRTSAGNCQTHVRFAGPC